MLSNLKNILGKGAAFAQSKKVDESVLLNARLAPDMFPLTRQVHIATDFAAAQVRAWPGPSRLHTKTTTRRPLRS